MEEIEPGRRYRSSDHEVVALRLGLASAGILLIHLAFLIARSAPMSQSAGGIPALVACCAGGILLLGMAGLKRPQASLRWLILVACVGDLVIQAAVWVQTSRLPDLVVTDIALDADLAGELLQRGENPYTWDFTGTFELYRTAQVASTPKLNGALEADFAYPALMFLLVVPFQAMGLPGAFVVSVMAHAVMLVLLFVTAPDIARPLILMPVMVGLSLVPLTLGGSMDIVWATLLVGMVMAWRRPTLRAVLFGLAAACRHMPWLLAPFLVIRIWRDQEGGPPLSRARHFIAVSGTTFLMVNAPFIVWQPAAWLRGVTEPMRDPLVFYSQGGLSSLSQLGLVVLPKSYYLVAALSVLLLLLFCYWRHYDRLQNTLWIMPGIAAWFSYRSLLSYWLYWVFPMLAALVTPATLGRAPKRKLDLLPTAAVVLAGLCALTVGAVILSSSPATIEVQAHFPLPATDGEISRMNVSLKNNSDEVLVPRFAVQQWSTGGNPLPWYIERGPLSLLPGQAGIYSIFAAWPERSFTPEDTALLVVTDAAGNYSLRGLATIDPTLAMEDDPAGGRR